MIKITLPWAKNLRKVYRIAAPRESETPQISKETKQRLLAAHILLATDKAGRKLS